MENSCSYFSQLFSETSFHIAFKDKLNLLPLIDLQNLYVEYDAAEKVYILYILMDLAKEDLTKIQKKIKHNPMRF